MGSNRLLLGVFHKKTTMTFKKLTLLVLTLCTLSAYAQKKGLTDHRNIVKINLNTDFDDEDGFPFMFSWETKTTRRQSLHLGLAPRYFKDDFYKRSGIGVNAEYRFYISKTKTGISGVYAGPFATFNTYKTTETFNNQTYTFKGNDFRGGFIFGHQWVYLSGFSLDLNLGIGFVGSSERTDDRIQPSFPRYYDRREGLLGRFNVGIGYAF